MITTNGEVKQTIAEPKKLGIRTTKDVGNEAPEVIELKPIGLGKMITTHDEPEVIRGRMAKIRARTEARLKAEQPVPAPEPVPEPKKGKGKKAE